ncbi:hypothetical protein ACWGJW_36040 [Streptomyces nigrescens]
MGDETNPVCGQDPCEIVGAGRIDSGSVNSWIVPLAVASNHTGRGVIRLGGVG